MKKLIIAVFIVGLPLVAFAQTYQIDWYVIGSGGGHSQSAAYQLDGTIGQPIVGTSSSSNYSIDAGFWVGATTPQGGCQYVPGDINGNGSANGIDVTYGVSYFKGGNLPPDNCGSPVGPCPQPSPFYAAGDVNGNCAFNGIDITFFVAYLKGLQPAILYCATCPPGGLAAPPAPAIMPVLAPSLRAGDKLGSAE
jgi:hypothetical protein